jgi:pyruvate,water dikinase
MAVLVQELVTAAKAGVVFTMDPVSGSGSDILIEATYGLGEALVSGKVTPDKYYVSRDTGALRSFTLVYSLLPSVATSIVNR